jgi:hypothetical protein
MESSDLKQELSNRRAADVLANQVKQLGFELKRTAVK